MALYAIDVDELATVTTKARDGRSIYVIKNRMSYCKDCAEYAASLKLCGYGGELVHRDPYSGCLDGRCRE